MRAWAAIAIFVGAALGFVGLGLLFTAGIMIFILDGSAVMDYAMPYLVGGILGPIVGACLIVVSLKRGLRRDRQP